MAAILFLVICDETMTFTASHTTDMDSAPKNHIETTHKVFFLKNAYRILSRWIFPFMRLTKMGDPISVNFCTTTRLSDVMIYIPNGFSISLTVLYLQGVEFFIFCIGLANRF